MYSLCVLALMVSVGLAVRSNIYYVKPNISSSCPMGTCQTWNQYTNQASLLYFQSGTSFIFLPGNHKALNAVTLTRLSNIHFRGLNGTLGEAKIIIMNSFMICRTIMNLRISDLTFVIKSNTSSSDSSTLKFENCKNIVINNCTFGRENSFIGTSARAIYASYSDINIIRSSIIGNTVDFGGAVLATHLSNITVTDSMFLRNQAKDKGGAIYLHRSSLVLTGRNGNNFISNSAGESGGAVHCESGVITSMQFSTARNQGYQTLFANNHANNGGGVYAVNSRVTIGVKEFDTHVFRSNSASNGGAIYFKSNRFQLRMLKLAGNNTFNSNSVSSFKSAGGAIYAYFSNFTLAGKALFSNNKAYYGAGLYIFGTDTIIGGNTVTFEQNEAEVGAGIFVVTSLFIANAEDLNFINNKAVQKGGAIRLSNFSPNYVVNITGRYFNNTAMTCGGAIYIETGYTITLIGINVTNSFGSGLCIYKGQVSFRGQSYIAHNQGNSGGAIRSEDSSLKFFDEAVFQFNSASLGGAIFSLSGGLMSFYGYVSFKQNRASETGGAIFAFDTNTTIIGVSLFTANSARRGGALYMNSATLNLFGSPRTVFATSLNYATEFGGAIYHEDSIIPSQCSFYSEYYQDLDKDSDLPHCFLQIRGVFAYAPGKYVVPAEISSQNDSSGLAGDYVYGGLLDRCRMSVHNTTNDAQNSMVPYRFLIDRALNIHSKNKGNTINAVSSRAYQLCFCETNEIYDCSNTVYSIEVYRGQTFRVSLLALNQIRVITSTTVTAKVSSNSSVRYYQSSQVIPAICSNVTYNVYSTESFEELVLYPDGPCRDTGLIRGVVQVNLRPCPDAFSFLEDRCRCEERLLEYNAACIIDEEIYITRRAGSSFWMNALYNNGTYVGLILYKTCPVDYCTNKIVNITLANSDVQCGPNRVGKLCGKCEANYSVMLGGTKCEKCKNTYLVLLIPFAAAGIILVLILTLTRFTVATGMINSIILYANIIQANKYLFGTINTTNVVTIAIAWLNLDLGIQTCFFNGLDAYLQTWLQFLFPLYIWILISLIIFSSKYSIIISKLIGSNPIAVLATLLLMSYAKILKIIIEVFSFVELDYPGYKVRVWLKDANVPYLQSKHLILAIVTAAICIFLFLPYTLLLLFGPKLYTIAGGKYYSYVMMKFKPLLDSYYAPYRKKTRFWTGFLLLVRCALYIVFSFNSLGGTSKSFMAINIVFTTLVITAWLSVTIYKDFSVNVIEAFVYLNIITLSVATLAESSSSYLVNSLVGSVLVLTGLIILYHIHHFHVAKTQAWVKLNGKIECLGDAVKKLLKCQKRDVSSAPMRLPAIVVSQDPRHGASKTLVDIREPLLENK